MTTCKIINDSWLIITFLLKQFILIFFNLKECGSTDFEAHFLASKSRLIHLQRPLKIVFTFKPSEYPPKVYFWKGHSYLSALKTFFKSFQFPRVFRRAWKFSREFRRRNCLGKFGPGTCRHSSGIIENIFLGSLPGKTYITEKVAGKNPERFQIPIFCGRYAIQSPQFTTSLTFFQWIKSVKKHSFFKAKCHLVILSLPQLS